MTEPIRIVNFWYSIAMLVDANITPITKNELVPIFAVRRSTNVTDAIIFEIFNCFIIAFLSLHVRKLIHKKTYEQVEPRDVLEFKHS